MRCSGRATTASNTWLRTSLSRWPGRIECRLEPLSSTDLAPLGIPDLHESTGGNPRFVAETVSNGNRPALSPTLSEALLGQCRAAGAYAHRVLLAASLLEQPFEPETLAALLHVDATELAEELERLCEHRILRVDGFHFRFRYDLVRQVLLTSISPARRRLLQAGLDRASTADKRQQPAVVAASEGKDARAPAKSPSGAERHHVRLSAAVGEAHTLERRKARAKERCQLALPFSDRC